MDNYDENIEGNLILADDVRIFSTASGEYRIRKGIWNYEEANLNLQAESENSQKVMTNILNLLNEGKSVSIDIITMDMDLDDEEKENIINILFTLRSLSYLQEEEDDKLNLLIKAIIGGEASSMFLNDFEEAKPVLFFGDTKHTQDYAKKLGEDINLPITIMGEKEYNDLSTIDLTNKYEAIEIEKQLGKYEKYFNPYSCIIGSMERPRISFLRNLNRIMIKLSKTLCLGIMDGPFSSTLTIKPPETGCFECFETRLLARMEDMAIYRKFVSSTNNSSSLKEKTLLSPLMNQITSSVIFEGFLVATINKAKFAGRVLNTYIPMMEIQIQDLLRVPFCPACGYIAESKMTELYTSSKGIVDNMVNKIKLK
ncbi:hypothetical protein ACFL20_08465 [Spirochaetota bacterium]